MDKQVPDRVSSMLLPSDPMAINKTAPHPSVISTIAVSPPSRLTSTDKRKITPAIMITKKTLAAYLTVLALPWSVFSSP